MPITLRSLALVAFALALALALSASAQSRVQASMICSRGDEHQTFAAIVTMASTRPVGSLLQIRIDGLPSGTISHFGLNYLHDMNTDYSLPRGGTYIEGSAQLVPGTGTANALQGASVRHEANTIRLLLPGHIDSGSSYTPPSIEFTLRVDALPGARLELGFLHYQLTANAIIIGDVLTSCEPASPMPSIATTLVIAGDVRP